jgi:hypothetical protein
MGGYHDDANCGVILEAVAGMVIIYWDMMTGKAKATVILSTTYGIQHSCLQRKYISGNP